MATRRIAFVSTITAFPWGGADTLWTAAAEAASAAGDRLLVAVSPAVASEPRVSGLMNAGATFTPLPENSSSLLHRIRRRWSARDRVVSALTDFAPELVVVSLGAAYDLVYWPALIASLRHRQVRYRLIVNWQLEHPDLSVEQWELARSMFKAAEAIYFVSTRNLVRTRQHLLLELPQAAVIHNPLRWTPADVSPWPAGSTLRLAAVTRLHPQKGVAVLLHALAELRSTQEWTLAVYGRGPERTTLEETVRHLNLDSRVSFCGYVPSLRPIWAENQLLCSASVEDGVPMTIPEAMLCARPTISTAVGGAEDWIDDGVNGFLCAAPTVPLLAASLSRAFAASDKWEDFGRRAALTAGARYRPDDYRRVIATELDPDSPAPPSRTSDENAPPT